MDVEPNGNTSGDLSALGQDIPQEQEERQMDVVKMHDIGMMIAGFKKTLGQLEKLWSTHAADCEYRTDDEETNCTHPDPSCDPVCEYDNCPFMKSIEEGR